MDDATLKRILAGFDCARRSRGFLSVAETAALADRGNVVMDPFSTLVAAGAALGRDNVLYPGVVLERGPTGSLTIGDRNVFHAGTRLLADGGALRVGDGNQFGEGGFVAKANRPGADIRIGDGGRYLGCPLVLGRTALGSGSQILGSITVQDCELAAGGAADSADPDARGAVLKGAGSARGIRVACGMVIRTHGDFRAEDATPQSAFHGRSR